MTEVIIEDLESQAELRLGINGAHPTFRLRTETIEAAALRNIDAVSEDLLEIATAVFFADGKIRRGGGTRPGMGRNWHRRMRITIPVREPELWRKPEVTAAVCDVVNFLTDDTFEFVFIPQAKQHTASGFLALDPTGAAFRADEVILFSGGLDSFAGALESLSTIRGNIILVSHRSATKVERRQDVLAAYLIDKFPDRIRHVKVLANRDGEEAEESTQRSRSFLFAAIAHAVATSFGAPRICFYENGVVSHNLPISFQVVGTMATRTTHPLALFKLNHLLGLIEAEPATISNGYEWLTKREVVERIARFDGLDMVNDAVSCTHVRKQTILHTHCGECSQCLDWRFAMLSAGLEMFDSEDSYATKVLFGPRLETAGRILAVEWTRHATRLGSMKDTDFLSRFGAEISRIVQGLPFTKSDHIFQRILDLQRRHAANVHAALSASIREKASDLALNLLEPTCLLQLHLGSTHGQQTIEEEPVRPWLALPTNEAPGEDTLFDPNRPLSVSFLTEGKNFIVIVKGLGRVTGRPAQVAHLLKDVFLEDVATPGLAAHRFKRIYTLAGADFSKLSANQNVKRCREVLAEAYQLQFEAPPKQHLLIESGGKLGHRIYPDTDVITGT